MLSTPPYVPLNLGSGMIRSESVDAVITNDLLIGEKGQKALIVKIIGVLGGRGDAAFCNFFQAIRSPPPPPPPQAPKEL